MPWVFFYFVWSLRFEIWLLIRILDRASVLCQLERRSFAWVTGKTLVGEIVQILLYFCWLYARWCWSLQRYEKVEMEKFRSKSHCGEIYPLVQKVFVEYFVRDRKAANWLQFIFSEKTQAVLEYPGVSWKVTRTECYVFSVGNIVVPLCMSSHLLMCI